MRRPLRGARTAMLRVVVCSTVIALALGLEAAQQAGSDGSAPQIAIVAPENNSFVSGPTLLRVRIEPQDAATTVTFFADGRQGCFVAHLPFECEWDAGATINPHQIPAAPALPAGGRIVHTIRTKGVGFSEHVNVDVVQVTVTVGDGHGKFVRGIPQSSFHVAEDGRTQAISHF